MVQPTTTHNEQCATITSGGYDIDAWRWISTYLADSAGVVDMSVDGSGGNPQSFFYTPPANYDFVAVRMVVIMITATGMVLTEFGDLGVALGTGIEIKANGVLITTWQDNIDMYSEFYDKLSLANVSDAAADTTINGRWTFAKDTNGAGIIVPNGQQFQVIINDDISGISQLKMKIKGKLVASGS